ncbi:MAG: nuclear protein [Candidatus Doudnabacteria bacterium]|nr:nuclear protein [Candidatus Doudnabacteria bacterium]
MEKTKLKESPVITVKRSKTGLGIYTKSEINKGDFVIEYIGERISNAEADKRLGMYLFELNKRVTIDGSSRKNIARYLNHSCLPNCEAWIKKGKIMIIARRKIKAGEELTYDYGKEFFNGFIKPIGCKCVKCSAK